MLDTLKGELRIFAREVEKADGSKRVIFNACVGYSTQENEDGETEYLNYYMLVSFAKALKKDVAKVYIQESFDVIVTEAWIKAYRDKDENVRPILFINKAKVVTADKKEEPKAKKTTSKGTTKKSSKKAEAEPIDDDSLPF